MITKLEIQNYRGFKNLTLEGLCRVNLFLGANDTGKTNLLEALVLLLGDDVSLQSLPVTFRSNQSGNIGSGPDDRENFWLWLFRERNPKNQLLISARMDDGQTVSLQSKVLVKTSGPPDESYKLDRVSPPDRRESVLGIQTDGTTFSSNSFAAGLNVSRLSVRPTQPVEDAEKYNVVALDPEGENKIHEVMQVIEPRLRRLRYAKLPGTSSPLVFADVGLPRAIPSTQMGQAFNRILHIYCEILSKNIKVLLIDEVENGIFSETMPAIWRGLLAICKTEDVQIFATTHSRECVMAAFATAEERQKDELAVYRLQRVKGQIEAVRLEAKHLELAAEMGLEVRS